VREFIEGNQAIVRAALDAGCTFFAGYPITPASEILAGMLQALPRVAVWVSRPRTRSPPSASASGEPGRRPCDDGHERPGHEPL